MLSFCPRPPGWCVDWRSIDEAFDWIRALRGCPQDPVFHAEGDVWVHTRMVCEALAALDGWRVLPEDEREVLFWSALLHDVAKPQCSVREDDGRISSRGHARRGAQRARRLLWEGGLRFAGREAVVGLVRRHALPLWLLEREDPARTAILASLSARMDHLALLAEADVCGRDCNDADGLLERIELFAELCRDQRCFDGPRAFASSAGRFLYARGRWSLPDYAPHEGSPDEQAEMVVLSGLPGSGKDHWIREHLPGLPAVSLDGIRRELGIRPSKDQGQIVQEARRRAREHLRAGQSFVWNATNLTRNLRDVLVELATSYEARTRIVYVEVSAEKLWRQNREREDVVPQAVMERFLKRWEVPGLAEAHAVEYWVDGDLGARSSPRPTSRD